MCKWGKIFLKGWGYGKINVCVRNLKNFRKDILQSIICNKNKYSPLPTLPNDFSVPLSESLTFSGKFYFFTFCFRATSSCGQNLFLFYDQGSQLGVSGWGHLVGIGDHLGCQGQNQVSDSGPRGVLIKMTWRETQIQPYRCICIYLCSHVCIFLCS